MTLRLASLAFSALLVLVVLALAPGVNGTFFYDDSFIFNQLPAVRNGQLSAWDFIASGFSVGPLGRPLSMVTFLWPLSAYPDHTQVIFAVNIALHTVNTLVVGLLAWRIGQMLKSPYALWLGVLTAALWGLAPIQAGTVFIAVQRMASLSALFVWLGLLLWVMGLQRASVDRVQGRVMQAFGLLGMTALAVLSKENGILLPLFAWVIESTLFANLVLHDRRPRSLLYVTISSVVFGYLLYSLWTSGGVFYERAFNVWERVITEAVILFEYLHQTIAPRFMDIHPFHDAHPIVHSLITQPEAALALLFWLIAAGLSWLHRKKWPMFAFAILWFLTAHLLESSVLSLELYYEHRQYIAWFGLAFVLTWGALHTPLRYQKIALVGLIVYILLLGFLMRQTAELWGKPSAAAEIWFKANPGSTRAAEHLALVYVQADMTDKAYETLKQQVTHCPECLSSLAQAIQLSCLLVKKSDLNQHLSAYFEQVQHAQVIGGTPSTLYQIHNQVKKSRCTLLDFGELGRMNQALLDRAQPLFDNKRQQILVNLYRIALEQGDIKRATSFMQKSYATVPQAELGLSLVRILLDQHRRDEAQRFTTEQLCAPSAPLAFRSSANLKHACLKAHEMLEKH